MPPQINEIISCNYSNRKNQLNALLMKTDALDSPYDTESTSSDELDTFFSKESLSSRDSSDLKTRLGISQRTAAVFSFECEEDSWEVFSNKDDHSHPCYKPSSKVRNGFRGKLRARSTNALIGIGFILAMMIVLLQPMFNRTSEWSNWRRFLHSDSPKLINEIQKMPTGTSFTIRLKGRRMDLLKQSLDSHSRCSSVEEIQIDFQGEDDVFPQVLLRYGAGKAAKIGNSSTAGIFLLNEGMTFSCEDLDNAFNTWKKDPRRFVGFFGFQPGNRSFVEQTVLGRTDGPYSILSDRAAFIHNSYLDALSPFSGEACCESLLSVQVSLASKMPPLRMKATPRQILEMSSLPSTQLGVDQGFCPEKCSTLVSRIGGLKSLPDSDAAILLGSR